MPWFRSITAISDTMESSEMIGARLSICVCAVNARMRERADRRSWDRTDSSRRSVSVREVRMAWTRFCRSMDSLWRLSDAASI